MIKLKEGQIVLDENGEEVEIEKGDTIISEKFLRPEGVKFMPYGKEMINLLTKAIPSLNPDEVKSFLIGVAKNAIELLPVDRKKYLDSLF